LKPPGQLVTSIASVANGPIWGKDRLEEQTLLCIEAPRENGHQQVRCALSDVGGNRDPEAKAVLGGEGEVLKGRWVRRFVGTWWGLPH
jgi:hypothetical protein